MNILITGITGLFGSQLAKEFSQLGKIHGLKKEHSKLDLLKDANFEIQWHKGELSDVESLLEALHGIDLVIHSAGLVSFSSRDNERLHQTNTVGTANLVNAMLSAGVTKLVYVSSVSAIGRSLELSVINEEFKWVESPLNTDYAISKYWAELEAWRGEQEGLDLIVVNPSVLLGKAGYGKSSTAIYSYVLEENKYFPKGNLNFIDVRDAAVITRALVEKQAWGQRYILNSGSISYREFFTEMASVFGKKPPKTPVSNWQIALGSVIFALLRTLGLSKSPLTKKTAMLAQQAIRFDNSKIQGLLNFRYTPLKESLEWAKVP